MSTFCPFQDIQQQIKTQEKKKKPTQKNQKNPNKTNLTDNFLVTMISRKQLERPRSFFLSVRHC